MVIWQGSGWFVVAIVFVTSFVVNLITDFFMGSGYYETHTVLAGIAVTLSSVLVYISVQKLHTAKETTLDLDVKTGKETVVKTKHAFFFIDIKYWPYIVFVLGVCTIIYQLFL